MPTDPYTKEFYDTTAPERFWAAREIMPEILHRFTPMSMVDIGCGDGTWLCKAREIDPMLSIMGIDGNYVDPACLMIPKEYFRAIDLEEGLPDELPPYDVAFCLEVAEHISLEAGERLVDWLCRHAEVIIWSAAIPEQGGVRHINEQWPSFWNPYFLKNGYFVSTGLRRKFWNDKRIAPYYRQNILEYMKSPATATMPLDVVHPEMWSYKINCLREAIRQVHK